MKRDLLASTAIGRVMRLDRFVQTVPFKPYFEGPLTEEHLICARRALWDVTA